MKILDRPGSRATAEAALLNFLSMIALVVSMQTDSSFFRILLGIQGAAGVLVAWFSRR